MKNIKLMKVRLFALAVAVTMAIVLTSAPKVNAQDEMSGMKMGKKAPPPPVQSGMKMGQGAKKKAPRKSAGMGGMGMKDDMGMDMKACCVKGRGGMDMEGDMKMMGSISAPKMAGGEKHGWNGDGFSNARLPRYVASLSRRLDRILPGSFHAHHAHARSADDTQ